MTKRNKIIQYTVLAIGLVLLLVFCLFAAFPSWFTDYGQKEMFTSWEKPSASHILGTNDMGYDIFTELVYATRRTLVVGVSAALIALTLGVLIGVCAGYFKGILGSIFNGFINVFMMLPKLPMLIVLAAYLGSDIWNMILIISLLGWVGTARAVRAKVIHIKNQPYIESMIGLGYSKSRIMFMHIMKGVGDVAAAKFVTSVAGSIMMESSLGFLGLGDLTNPTWGTMINFAYKRGGFMMGAYNWLITPGVCIMLLTLAFYLINYYFEQRRMAVRGGGSILE